MTKFRRKLIALAITMVMIISSLGSAFAAADNSAAYQESANILQEYGVMVGDNGDLMLDKQLKRQDAIIISLRLMGIEDSEFENYQYQSDFSDIRDAYYLPIIGMAQDLGLVEGMGDGTFGFSQLIKAQDVATLLLRALGYEITDEVYPNALQMAQEVGILNLVETTNNELITRDIVAQMMLNTLNANVKDGTQKLGEVLGYFENTTATVTITADSTKSFKAVFSKEVDSAAAKFDVKKDELTAKVSSVTWNDEKTEATLNMANKLTEGDYVISVSGIEVENSTTTVTIKDEEAARIEFTTDKAIKVDDSNEGDVYTFIKVYNQYNQDITKDANLDITASRSTSVDTPTDDGKVVIHGSYEEDDKLTVSAIDTDSDTFATATLTVVEMAVPDQIEIVKLYSEDEDAVLKAKTDDVFSLLLKIYDQYGNVMTDDDENETAIQEGIMVSTSNSSRIDVEDEDNITIEEIDDVKYAKLDLTVGDNEGSVTIRVTSKRTGKSTSYALEVLPEEQIDTVSLTAPSIAVFGEEIKFEVDAKDTNGNAVTDLSTFADNNLGVDVSISGIGSDFDENTDVTFKKEGGKVYLILDTVGLDASSATALNLHDDSKNNEYKTIYITVDTATGKIIRKSVRVYENAVPASMGNLINVKTGILQTNSSNILASADDNDNNITVLDQYDRVMEWADVFPNYSIRFDVENATKVSFASMAGTATDSITAVEGSVDLYGIAKGSQKVTITLVDDVASEDVDGSDISFTANVVELGDIKSFEVEEIDTIFAYTDGAGDPASVVTAEEALTAYYGPITADEDESGNNDDEVAAAVAAKIAEFDVTVKVNGILSSGAKVEIPASLFTVVASLPGTNLSHPGLTINDDVIQAPTVGLIPFETNKDTLTGKVTVTIGAKDGPVSIEKALTVSKASPVAETITLDDTAFVEINGNNASVDVADATLVKLLAAITVKDQYGVDNPLVQPASIVFSNLDDANDAGLDLVNGAYGTAAINAVDSDDTFTMTVIYANGKSISIDITIN